MGLLINNDTQPCISLYSHLDHYFKENETTAALELLEAWPILGKMGTKLRKINNSYYNQQPQSSGQNGFIISCSSNGGN